MSFFASLPSVEVAPRRFDTFIDALVAPDNSSFRIAIRRLNTGTRDVVASLISPSYPLNTPAAIIGLSAVVAYGGSPSERRTLDQIKAAAAKCPRSNPAAIEVLNWRADGDLPAWEQSRDRVQRSDDLDTITGAKPAAAPFTGRKQMPAAAAPVEHEAPVG
jgi:hypothetical protein